jgi:6-phosphogluconate dehydrogenase (decarboxylating)
MQVGMIGLSATLFERVGSRGEADFPYKLLSAMRNKFGCHLARSAPKAGA